jgi:hypothetical protein
MQPGTASMKRSSGRPGGGDVDRLKLIRERAKKRRARKPTVCGNCGGVGHNARTCRSRRAPAQAVADRDPGELDARLDFDHEPIPAALPPPVDREPAPEQELEF